MSAFLDRRSLLLGAGALPLATGAASAQTPQAMGQPMPGGVSVPDPLNKRLRFAVVGLGTIAVGQMIPAFLASQHAEMTAFVSGNPQKARDLGARYGVTHLYDYDSFDRIAHDDTIDVVYIALPVALHAEYAIRAFKAGKHVLCEKPMASTPEDCEAMIAAAKAAGKQLGVTYRIHFEPNNADAVKRLKAGELGTLRHVSGDAGFSANPDYPPHKWRLTKAMAGGGSMYDIGIYALNAALDCAGEDPVSVTAVYSTPKGDPRFAEVEGGVEWRLRFPSGISAQGSSSYCYQYTSRLSILGSSGYIEMQPFMDYTSIAGVYGHADFTSTPLRAGVAATQFTALVDAYCAAVQSNQPFLTGGDMGLRDIRLIQAIYRSADADGAIVQL